MNPEYIAFLVKQLELLADGIRTGRVMPDVFETRASHGTKSLHVEWTEPVRYMGGPRPPPGKL